MDFFDQLPKAKGGYIFLSHSHSDIEKVRKIRNDLEQSGFEPLCFYLKCLNEDGEIEDLIKREIDAREWFIFVDSENSRHSKWVTLEREYITKTNEKKIITVNIHDELAVRNAIRKLQHNLRIYLSYSHADSQLARRIKERLENKDYLVYFDEDNLTSGSGWLTQVTNAITLASRDGCVLALISPNFLRSSYTMNEITFAYEKGGNVIPVLIGDATSDGRLRLIFGKHPVYRLSDSPTDAEIDALIEQIGRYILKK